MIDPELQKVLDDIGKLTVAPETTAVGVSAGARIRTALEAARDKHKRSTNPDRRYDADLITRVLRAEVITDADELVKAAVAVTRNAPTGVTADQVRGVLSAASSGDHIGRLLALSTWAVEKVASDRAADGVDGDDFEIDQKTMKPSSTSQKNMRLALKMLNVNFHYDQFARKKIIEREGARDIVRDKHVRGLGFEIERQYKFYPSREKFQEYCADFAERNSFHPVLEYFDGLKWDGVPRVETWLIEHGGAQDTPYVRAVSRIVLVAAARRVRVPGCKFDEMLILESIQGTRKSSALVALCPRREWFTDNVPLNAESKLLMERTAGKLIVEAPELRGMTAHDHNALKMMLSCAVDESRMAYGREVESAPRQFVFIGTTNDEVYLVDPTGARRYWPVAIDEFDVDALVEIRDQIWAEAVYLDLQNADDEEYIRLPPELYKAAAEEQEKRYQQDAYEHVLSNALSDEHGLLTLEDTWRICGFAEKPPNRGETQRIAQAMARLQWVKTKRRRAGKPTHCYATSKDITEGWLEVKYIGTGIQVVRAKGIPAN